eukprot:TRINITY_DN10526_c0_g1_i1.p1 TRINITY_DN10526_c0_g1~~TRINITY_DN10526_c0_g1_i1.p1  ORF type:complete len:309 (+),score=75.44 TRINITY_DN10526_c0_g1_i1:157-1083(+)
MATGGVVVDTQHADMIHDAQFDYYGKRVATCSSDKSIKIFSVGDSANNSFLAELRGHEGPVWQVSWAHPKYGSIIASCSYDRKVFIWKEINPNQWQIIFQFSGHELSVNAIAWAPHEHGLILACASSDGTISILTCRDNNEWTSTNIPQAHQIGVNAVSWAPAVAAGSLVVGQGAATTTQKRLVSGGCDNSVKIWVEVNNRWEVEHRLEGDHKEWVRDVCWAPNIGLPTNIIASCSQDSTVIIWTQEDVKSTWVPRTLPKFTDAVWRVSWSVTGNILAVASGDNKVSLWKEGVDGEWKKIEQMDETQK